MCTMKNDWWGLSWGGEGGDRCVDVYHEERLVGVQLVSNERISWCSW